jgi:ABC-2 type transport system ATP-binding protein
VSLRVERGEIFGLLGPNGAGKTTLIKILLGIVRKSGGQATLLDRPAGERVSRYKIGYLPENLRMPAYHTARTALHYYGRLSGLSRSEILAHRDKLLEQVGLADRTREPIKKYSKGMLQRLGLAQALLHDTQLLILDEPTDGLDPVGRSQVRSVLHRLKAEGKTIFLNSHILQEVELVCDRVAILDKGLVKAQGGVDQIAPQQTEGVELDLVVTGAEPTIRRALAERGVNKWETNGGEQHRLSLRLLDQSAVNACIDDLRREDISIVGMTRRRVTLEDAFLKLLAGPTETAEAVDGSAASSGSSPPPNP